MLRKVRSNCARTGSNPGATKPEISRSPPSTALPIPVGFVGYYSQGFDAVLWWKTLHKEHQNGKRLVYSKGVDP